MAQVPGSLLSMGGDPDVGLIQVAVGIWATNQQAGGLPVSVLSHKTDIKRNNNETSGIWPETRGVAPDSAGPCSLSAAGLQTGQRTRQQAVLTLLEAPPLDRAPSLPNAELELLGSS